MSIAAARKRPPTADSRRYDSAFVVVAVPVRGLRTDGTGGTDDRLASPVAFRLRLAQPAVEGDSA